METITKTGYPDDDPELAQSIANEIAAVTLRVITDGNWPCYIETPTKEMATLIASAIIKLEEQSPSFSAKQWKETRNGWIVCFDWTTPDIKFGSIVSINVKRNPSKDEMPDFVGP